MKYMFDLLKNVKFPDVELLKAINSIDIKDVEVLIKWVPMEQYLDYLNKEVEVKKEKKKEEDKNMKPNIENSISNIENFLKDLINKK